MDVDELSRQLAVQARRLEGCQRRARSLERAIYKHMGMTLWQRLRWAFRPSFKIREE